RRDRARLRGRRRRAVRGTDDRRAGRSGAAPVPEVRARGPLRRERRGDDARPEAGVRAVRAVRGQAAGVLGPPTVGPARLIGSILGSGVDTWATVAVAIGTIGAVAYALFRDLVVGPRRRPRLELRFDRAGNDQIVVATPSGSEVARVRLRVGNRAGKDTA